MWHFGLRRCPADCQMRRASGGALAPVSCMDQRTGAGASIDTVEIERFDVPLDVWWSTAGEAGWLHKYNHVRVPYIRDRACRQFRRDPHRAECLKGLRILDIGCGGGLLCEPLARYGATVTGADPAPGAIEAARLHALQGGVAVDYRCTTAEALASAGEAFDVVLAMEVIEHVADHDVFLERCADLVAPGGLMILSTINRTFKSWAYAIVAAEYILRLLPRGTHQWERFLRPEEIGISLAPHGLRTSHVSGVTMNVLSRKMQLAPDTAVNYIMTAERVRGTVPAS
jgi:2-polyprenyl-6-hydroxyphenyl methylase/3-demethylubiquinone-9 3-methyltransferase